MDVNYIVNGYYSISYAEQQFSCSGNIPAYWFNLEYFAGSGFQPNLNPMYTEPSPMLPLYLHWNVPITTTRADVNIGISADFRLDNINSGFCSLVYDGSIYYDAGTAHPSGIPNPYLKLYEKSGSINGTRVFKYKTYWGRTFTSSVVWPGGNVGREILTGPSGCYAELHIRIQESVSTSGCSPETDSGYGQTCGCGFYGYPSGTELWITTVSSGEPYTAYFTTGGKIEAYGIPRIDQGVLSYQQVLKYPRTRKPLKGIINDAAFAHYIEPDNNNFELFLDDNKGFEYYDDVVGPFNEGNYNKFRLNSCWKGTKDTVLVDGADLPVLGWSSVKITTYKRSINFTDLFLGRRLASSYGGVVFPVSYE